MGRGVVGKLPFPRLKPSGHTKDGGVVGCRVSGVWEEKRTRSDEVGRSWSHTAPLMGQELQSRGDWWAGWGQAVWILY